MNKSSTITRYEEIAMNAWPALQTLVYDGWVLRFANGVTRRANSINPIYPSGCNIQTKIEFCEKLYASHNLPVIYKITESVFPEKLDEILTDNNYEIDAETSLQTISLNNVNLKQNNNASFCTNVNPSWVNSYIKFNGHEENKFETFYKIIDQVRTPKCLMNIEINKHIVACGLGVIEGSYMGLFDIVVAPEHRKHGYGKEIVESLMHWGKTNGAQTAYLQVMLNNQPALKLYEKLGFTEEYKYWYRVKK
jgi:N-acetylglutamate synthase